jgi:hypothetical protein
MLSEAFDEDVWQYMLEEKKKGKSIPQIILDNGEQIGMVAETDYANFNPFNGQVAFALQPGYRPELQDIEGNVYYHGYWIDYRWFKRFENEFRNEFTFPPLADYENQKLMDKIQNGNSLGIHIRRGDYVNIGKAAPADIIGKLVQQCLDVDMGHCTLYVFSDDIDWCRKNAREAKLDKFAKTVYVSGNVDGKNYIDLQLMSNCKGMIMSNSAFCYLSVILNKNLVLYLNPTDRIMWDFEKKN